MNFKAETLAVHGGQKVEEPTLSRGVPVHRTTAYLFKNTAHAAKLFALEEMGNIYTRLGNPTQAILEERIALLEEGVGSVAFASGTAAIFSAIINIAKNGDEIIATKNLYGGTYTMLDVILPDFGIKTKFVEPNDLKAIEAAITKHTKAIFTEIIGNPLLEVADIEGIANIAKKHNLPFILDSTFATPFLCKPFKHGADIVIHSLSKWIGGHGTGIGGIVVSNGKFDWKNKGFDLYDKPDPSYHNLRWGHDVGAGDPFILRLRTVPLRNLGACISPDNAWMFLQGLETLHLRMERHSENAMAVANFLSKHKAVSWVNYPGLADNQSHKHAIKYLKNGFGGMVVFGIAKGKEAGGRFIDSLKLFSLLANVGDAKSLALHPGTTTHSQLTDEQQLEAGIKPEMIRLSIGIEHIDDIIADLAQALNNA